MPYPLRYFSLFICHCYCLDIFCIKTTEYRNFAAPEIVNKVRPRSRRKEKAEQPRKEQQKLVVETEQQQSENTEAAAAAMVNTPTPTPITETISDFVADYGLLVDSYSMGHTMRYMMTGVQPGLSIDDAIQKQQRGGWLLRKLFSLCSANNNNNNNTTTKSKEKRSVRYRQLEDLPGEVYKLIACLTEPSEQNRISIRKARRTIPWISDVFLSQNQPSSSSAPSPSPPSNKVEEDDEKDKEEQIEETSASTTTTKTKTTTTTILAYHVSEEQLHPLHQLFYLSFATDAVDADADADSDAASCNNNLDVNHETSLNDISKQPYDDVGNQDQCDEIIMF